ncbi:hypothetical protein [Delftia lacustris]|uniref:Uncharacterized protein n=1 Tax=Delftia lacustris TaxID=558537 RepID=A0A1H3TI96_9BURK|nr:hypothetical protein [Delftia lacustris]SDZ49521.1 hypothetical protein SAMN05421547_12880 [Delftia lacustris]
MTITLEAIRAAGGIVHSDGNIFFRDISMLQGLAGAAPAAVAPQGVVAWMHPETLNVISAAHKHDMSTEYGAETRRKAESHSVALVRAGEPAVAAPALEAPPAVAPQGEYPHEQMDAMALARYKVVPSHASMLWSHAVVAGDGVQQLYVGREAECQNMARKFAGAFLDGAFAFHSMAAAPTTQAAPALEAPAAPSRTSVAVLQCDCCGHIGINDAADGKAACNTCRWTGDSPAEDKCPGCNRVGTMTTACPECGARTTLIAETHLQAPAALEAPAAPPPRTTGYIAPKGRYVPPVLFNPYTGEPRDARDIASDPQGVLIVPPGAAIQRVREG